MAFHSLHDFIHMGGYASYVWSAYGITFLILGIQLFNALRRKKYASRS
jgi:heme exporter protein D